MSRLERMKSYLPAHFAESREILAILEDGNKRFEEVSKTMDDVLNQFFVQTATWYISKWEDELDILPNETDLDTRRNRIISKLTNYTPTNYRAIESEVNRFLRNPTSVVRLIENEYAFEITIPATDLFKPKKDIVDSVERIKPAHLRMEIVAEIINTILWIIDNTYDFHVQYPICGDMEPSRADVSIEEDEMRVTESSYDFSVEYEVSETKVCSPSEEKTVSIDQTYDFAVEYPICGEMQPSQAQVKNSHYKSTTKDNSYTVNVVYPVCGDFYCGEEIS